VVYVVSTNHRCNICNVIVIEEAIHISVDTVTFESYETAVIAMADCIRENGFELNYLDLDPASRLYDYEVPLAAADNGVYDKCYSDYLEPTDMAWQRHQAPEAASQIAVCAKR